MRTESYNLKVKTNKLLLKSNFQARKFMPEIDKLAKKMTMRGEGPKGVRQGEHVQYTSTFGTPDLLTANQIRLLRQVAIGLTDARQDTILVEALRDYIAKHSNKLKRAV